MIVYNCQLCGQPTNKEGKPLPAQCCFDDEERHLIMAQCCFDVPEGVSLDEDEEIK
jgi:hypothetical protein